MSLLNPPVDQTELPEVSEKQALTEYPLNPFETGMYIEQKLHPESMMYNVIGFYDISGVSAEQVKTALEEIFHSHEAFHSVYREKNGILLRVLTDDIPAITIQHIDDIKTARELANSLDKPYDLSGGIPVKAVIYTDGQSCIIALLYHHIMYDGGSDLLFSRELFARLTGNTPVKDDFDLSSASQQDCEPAFSKGFEKYQEMYADGVPVTELPLKIARPKIHPDSDTNRFFAINGDMLQNIKQTARQKSVTKFELLLSAYSMTAAKYTASEDIVIGVPVNTRTENTRNTIGMFVNTAPLRLKPVRTKNTDEYIHEVKNTVYDCIKNNTCPYDRLVTTFVRERDTSRNPLFDIGINYIPMQTSFSENGVSLNSSYRLQPSGKDINLIMQVTENNINCYLQYSSELFDDTVIGNFIEQFLCTTEKLCNDQAVTVRDALTLPDLQQKALNDLSTAANADIPVKLLHKMFEKAADSNPDKTALIACDKTMTFAELESESNRVANALIQKGFVKGDSAVVMLHRTSRFFAALFGVLKAGGAFIPMDPHYPAERIHSVIDDSDSRFVITDEVESEYSNSISIKDLLSCETNTRPDVDVSPDDLAYMIYTSGSTGKPKGVMLRHIGICNYLTPHPVNIQAAFQQQDRIYLSVYK